jgi:hypothetical protein
MSHIRTNHKANIFDQPGNGCLNLDRRWNALLHKQFCKCLGGTLILEGQ